MAQTLADVTQNQEDYFISIVFPAMTQWAVENEQIMKKIVRMTTNKGPFKPRQQHTKEHEVLTKHSFKKRGRKR